MADVNDIRHPTSAIRHHSSSASSRHWCVIQWPIIVPATQRIYREAMASPGVIVLHDVVLHHLIVEMTLARGDADGYIAALEANHGPAGAAWALGRANGLHSEMGNFLLPASIDVANRSRAVIVHNRYAKERLESFGVTTPIHVVPHPYVMETRRFDRDRAVEQAPAEPYREHRALARGDEGGRNPLQRAVREGHRQRAGERRDAGAHAVSSTRWDGRSAEASHL